MKRNLFFAQLLLILLVCTAHPLFARQSEPFSRDKSPLSKPASPIMDNAGVLDAGTKLRLEKLVNEYSETSNPSVEIGVAIVKTTGDVPIFDYSLAVARGWGIGSREDDNPGLLLLVAVEDRKYFTQVSKDLEDELPDGIVGSIQRRYLVPPFKQGNYSKGIEDTVNAYIKTIESRRSGETAPPPSRTTTAPIDGRDDFESSIGRICQILGCLFVIFIFVMFAANSSRKKGPDKKDRDRWGGGGGSSGGSSGGADIALAILGALLSGSGGGGSSSSSGWGSGGSSSWGGGSSGGWGGFGGGGDFGGGGSGGSW
ncbi:MAG: TPM domain-containing protein [Pyrinomonadaceae bacterium]|nr:TPM domain-containing protein [Pyrinomonadaceae bacterium]